ncbi:MAG: hypothetical protein ABH857_02910 [Elusimicrobiota bacterium]
MKEFNDINVDRKRKKEGVNKKRNNDFFGERARLKDIKLAKELRKNKKYKKNMIDFE